MNVYNTKTKIVTAAKELSAYGLPTEPCQSWAFFNWYELIDGPIIPYNEYIEEIVFATPVEYGDGRYIRYYITKQLSDEKIYANIRDLKQRVIEQIDKCTRDKIFGGFDKVVTVDGKDINLHFSYDQLDQKNFTDTASMTVMYLMADEASRSGMISTVVWNGYKDYTPEHGGILTQIVLDATGFSDLYLSATKFKDACLEEGKIEKIRVLNFASIDTVLVYATSKGYAV